MCAVGPVQSDDDLAELDIAMLLRFGAGEGRPLRATLFGDGAVGAAVVLERAGVRPRAVAFLAQIVRSGGTAYAAKLDEPVPGRAAGATVREWLEAAACVRRTVSDDEQLARWLSAVAEIIAVRRIANRTHGGDAA